MNQTRASRPPDLLAFDQVAATSPAWDGSWLPLLPHRPQSGRFHCQSAELHRIEVFLDIHGRHNACHLRLRLHEDHGPILGPLLRLSAAVNCLEFQSSGWFSFEFEPLSDSRGKALRFVIESADASLANHVSLRSCSTGLQHRALSLKSRPLYENFKRLRRALRHPTQTADFRPLLLGLEISSACNLGCIMCPRGLRPFIPEPGKPAFMSLELVKRLDPLLETLLRLNAIGLGEVFLNPAFLDILRHVRHINPNARLFTSTNITRLSEQHLRRILEENLLDELQFSIDGARAATFERIRPGVSYTHSITQLERCIHLRNQQQAPLQVLSEMVVMQQNHSEVLSYVRLMTDLGVNRILVDSAKGKDALNLRADSDSEMACLADQIREAKRYADSHGAELTGPLLWELRAWMEKTGRTEEPIDFGTDPCASLRQPARYKPALCGAPWEGGIVTPDGRLRVCCNNYREIGNLFERHAETLWLGSTPPSGIRQELSAGTPEPICQFCLGANVAKPFLIAPQIYMEASSDAWSEAPSFHRYLGRPLASLMALEESAGSYEIETQTELSDPLLGPICLRLNGALSQVPQGQDEAPLLALAMDGHIMDFTNSLALEDGALRWSALLSLPIGMSAENLRERMKLVLLQSTPQGLACLPLAEQTRSERVPPPIREVPGAGFVDAALVSNNILQLRGWACDPTSHRPAARVLLMQEGRLVATTRPWIERRDVAHHLSTDALQYGFALEVGVRDLSPGDFERLRVLALLEDGSASPLVQAPVAIGETC